MNKSFVAAGLGVLIATSALSAQAAERWPRWYVGLTGGYTFMSDQDISGAGATTQLQLDNGYGFGGSIGYLPSSSAPLLNNMRFELEVTHHESDVDSVTISGAEVGGNGSYSSTAYMANAFYDWQGSGGWSPYIGAGVGVATVHLSTNSGVGNTETSQNEFAYQGLAGIGYSPSSLPNTQWSLGYRYLATSDVSFNTGATNADIEYSSHSVEVGAKFRF